MGLAMALPVDIVLKQGWLNKLGGQVKHFKKRWFKLNGRSLDYFKSAEADSALGSIVLGGAPITQLTQDIYGLENCVGICPFGRKRQFVIQCASRSEMDEWLRLIQHIATSTADTVMKELEEHKKEEKEDMIMRSSSDSSVVSGSRPDRVWSDASMVKSPCFDQDDPDAYQYSDSDSDDASDLSIDSISENDEADEVDTSTLNLENIEIRASNQLQEKKEEEGFLRPSAAASGRKKTIRMQSHEVVAKTGFMNKLGAKVKNWKRRFFVLRGFQLQYYDSHNWKDKEMLGEVHLVGSVVRMVPEDLFDRLYVFSITQYTGERRTYYCCAANEEDMKKWMNQIRKRHYFCPLFPSLKVFEIKMTMNPDQNALQDISVEGRLKADQISTKKASRGIKGAVSKQKRRYVDANFDLDLTYITDRIIAMGFPSTGTESMYRNSSTDVINFFEKRHNKHYKVYNLCSERKYDPSLFDDHGGQVAWFPFDDHNVCAFQDIAYFCKDVAMYLNEHPKNVAAIHCKAGKGRTGLMISIFLLYCGEWSTSQEALSYYGFARTSNQQGVTIPSQIRWVHHFGDYMARSIEGKQLPETKRYQIKQIRFSRHAPSFSTFVIINHGTMYRPKVKGDEGEQVVQFTQKTCSITKGQEINFTEPVPCVFDVFFEFSKKTGLGGKKKKVMSFWLHTSFLPENNVSVLTRKKHKVKEMNIAEIDKATKYEKDFTIEVEWELSRDQTNLQKFPYLDTDEV